MSNPKLKFVPWRLRLLASVAFIAVTGVLFAVVAPDEWVYYEDAQGNFGPGNMAPGSNFKTFDIGQGRVFMVYGASLEKEPAGATDRETIFNVNFTVKHDYIAFPHVAPVFEFNRLVGDANFDETGTYMELLARAMSEYDEKREGMIMEQDKTIKAVGEGGDGMFDEGESGENQSDESHEGKAEDGKLKDKYFYTTQFGMRAEYVGILEPHQLEPGITYWGDARMIRLIGSDDVPDTRVVDVRTFRWAPGSRYSDPIFNSLSSKATTHRFRYLLAWEWASSSKDGEEDDGDTDLASGGSNEGDESNDT